MNTAKMAQSAGVGSERAAGADEETEAMEFIGISWSRVGDKAWASSYVFSRKYLNKLAEPLPSHHQRRKAVGSRTIAIACPERQD